MTIPLVSATRNSAVSSYRAAWGIWIGLSLIYAAGYLHVAMLHYRLLQGLVLSSTFLVQALFIPAYTLRQKFGSKAESVIQSSAAAVTIVGLLASVLILIEALLRHFTVPVSIEGLQFGYVATTSLLSGVIGGTSLGVLRWRMLQAQPMQAIAMPADAGWRHYLRSAMLWTASVTVYSWVIHAWLWAASNSYSRNLPAEILWGVAGLFLIAPIPMVSPLREAESLQRRIWRYSKYAIVVVLVAFGLASPFILGIWFVYFPLFSLVLWPPCLSWAVLYGWSVRSSGRVTRTSENAVSSDRPERHFGSNSKVVWWSAAGQACALLAGLLATAPVSLGFHGVGCLTVFPTDAGEYWFWKAYKGLGSEVQTGKGMILRPAVDSSVCMTLDQKALASLSDPNLVSSGYVDAARSWSWLIDQEQWDSERTKQIRGELTRLLGRDSSSYEDLQTWWEQNGRYLAWSSTDQLLEVQEPGLRTISNPYVNQQSQEAARVVATESIRQDPWLFGPKPMGGGPDYPGFRSLAFDREARFRGLKLYAADNIQILAGERPRRVLEFLHKLTGDDFSTKAEWQQFFAQSSRANPWRMSREGAQNMIASIQQSGSRPENRAFFLASLQRETGLTYSRLEDYIAWLQNPDNTRSNEWANAEQLVRDLDDDHELSSPISPRRWAMGWMKDVTDQSFDSPEKWVRWWQENRANLVLSEDGRKLVSRRK